MRPRCARWCAPSPSGIPTLYYDLHVTDGTDYQYDITFGWNGRHSHSPRIATWLDSELRPALDSTLSVAGHVPGPLIFATDNRDPAKGISNWTSPPRFSNGYGDVRRIPTVLVENHSLKPYEQRVLGTYVLLAGTLELLGKRGGALRDAIAADRALRPAEVTLAWRAPDSVPPMFDYRGVEAREVPSSVSGAMRVEWTGRPVRLQVPYIQLSAPAARVGLPRAYWVPATWPEVIERLRAHGIAMETLDAERELACEAYRIEGAKLEEQPFEGRARVSGEPVSEKRTMSFPAGSVRVPVDQPLGVLAAFLLEPSSDDSFFRWGFFLEILQETEYFESYVMEPMAERMLTHDAALRAEFDAKLASDSLFAADGGERLRWLYRKTPFHDERWRLYPVAREVADIATLPDAQGSDAGR